MLDEDNPKPVAKTEKQKPPTTTYSNAMDKVNSTVLKTSIEGILLLKNDNYSLWRIRVVNLLDLVGLKEHVVGDSKNADSAKAIWKSITAFFASTQSSNKARVFKSFLRAQYTPSDIPGFITSMKSFQARLLEVGWDLPADGLGHLVMDKFPALMDPIYDMITHSRKEIMEVELAPIQSPSSPTALRNASEVLTTLLLRTLNPTVGCFTPSSDLLIKTRPKKSKQLTQRLRLFRRLVLEEYIINFYKNSFEVVKYNEIKMTGNYVKNLPTLEFENCKFLSHLSSAEFIHKSLGHVSYHRLRKKLGIPLKIIKDCESCAVAKVTRASYKSEHAAASKPFEEIHLDLIGPIWPASNFGHRYILTLVDSCTRFCATIPIKSKSEVMVTFPFLIDVEAKRFGYHPSTIHSDRGSEFINSSLMEYCENHLIKQCTSDAYMLQQNGLAERFNRTILESRRTILEDSRVSKKYWNEIATLFLSNWESSICPNST
ncbi:hypothetical protein VP01_4151g3 [Puccinia sorghi]|uniref:Integrase catalytic domain-containing protein n=1 Tax=Puccinia sorghi TaxID=27349 RepID=A0A0L6UQZ9_9BASI|nr:hypothetical protein VP01_4151g3 [Puccinia sorghi]